MKSLLKLGEEIKIARNLLKYEQKEFAKILGISNVYLSNLEKGKKIPSDDLLERIYKELNQPVPVHVLELLKASRSEHKNTEISSSNLIYELQQTGIYSESQLREQLKTEPENIKLIYGLLNLLKDEGKIDEARQHLLQSLIHIKKEEVKRWLEALYFFLEKNFKTAIELMKKALEEFDKNNLLTEENKIKKAGLFFELACMYYETGYYQYNYENDKQKAMESFTNALKYFNEQRKLHKEAYYELYYANVFWWLAYLGIEPKSNWELYIDKAENVLLLNHEHTMKNAQVGKLSKQLYAQPYLLQLISSMAEAYAQLAKIEKKENTLSKEHKDKKLLSLLKKGEFLFAQHAPISITPEKREYYNFYFSYACFYSIKAEIFSSMELPFENSLELCYKGLQEVLFSDSKSKSKQFLKDIIDAEKKELKFYSEKRTDEFNSIKQKGKLIYE